MLVIGSVAVGLAVALFVVLLVTSSRTVATPGRREPTAPVVTDDLLGPRASEFEPLYRRFGALAKRLTPANYLDGLQRRLDIAGNPSGWQADRVLAMKGLGLTGGALLGLLLALGPSLFDLVVATALGAAIGFFLPDIWIRNLGQRRQFEVRNGLPDVIDMMTVCVEAGIGFDAALARVAQKIEGPAAAEFARVLQEMQFGKSRVQALRDAAERTEIPEHRAFITSIVQSTQLGISIGDVLRSQSEQMRIKRRQRAEEAAQKLPVKILLPLILCILPAMFVVVLGPAILNIVHFFAGH